MAKITRATQKIFAGNANINDVTAFGTAKNASPVRTKDPALLQSAAFFQGWNAAVEADYAPFEEDTNGLCYLLTRQLAYLYQQGTPEWDAGTTYYKNSLCTVVENNNLIIKRSLTDENINNNPLTDLVNWTDFFSQRVIHTIGDPIFTLNPVLEDNEIWLDGSARSRTTYSNLFQIYGTTYGAGNGSTTFNVPNFVTGTGRTIWGANTFGYISAGLPNITGTFEGASQNSNYTTGAFYVVGRNTQVANNGEKDNTYGFDASRSSSIYGNSTTVQPPAVKVRVKTRWK